MKTLLTKLSSVAMLALSLSLLSSCGGGGGGSSSSGGGTIPPQLGGSGNYGTLTFSGTGTATAGTTFNARTKLFVASGTLVTTTWYNIDLTAGITYPYIVLAIGQDNGVVTFVEVVKMLDANNNTAGQWVLSPMPTPSGTTATSTNFTFTNVTVPGYVAASTTTALTLNGTLNF
jgi:hypothetical protein